MNRDQITKQRAVKGARLLRRPRLWPPFLRHRVLASLEHENLAIAGDIRTVFDVGASCGQFALFALHRFPMARIVCFEPLPEAKEVLAKVVPSDRSAVHGVAVGSSEARREFHVTASDDSSSLLPIGDRQREEYPETEEVRSVMVDVVPLERYLYDSHPRPCLLKLDIQGAELEALEGAGKGLANVDYVLVECSFVELYDGQPLWEEVASYLARSGFALLDIGPIVRSRQGGLVQADLLFSRERSHLMPG